MGITDDDLKRAEARMRTRATANTRAVAVRYDRRASRIVVKLESGLDLLIFPGKVEDLAHASPNHLSEIEITPSGLGLHFPRLDADLYLPALIEGFPDSMQ